MPIEYKRMRCPSCRAIRRADRNAPDALLYLGLTMVTGGFWLLVWFYRSANRGPWRCGVCGRNLGGATRIPPWSYVAAALIVAAIVGLVGLALVIAAAAGRVNS